MQTEKERLEDEALKSYNNKIDLSTPKPQPDERLLQIQWHEVDRSEMPYGGKFYPREWKFFARPALGMEIADFSIVNVEDPVAVHEGMSNIISSCIKIEGRNGERISFKNIYEFDRLWFVLYIRHVSMPTPENKLTYKDTCEVCGFENEVSLDYFNLCFNKMSEIANKYFDENANAYIVKTASYGVLKIQPSNIYRANAYKEFVFDNMKKSQKIDNLFARLYWLFLNDDNQHEKNAMQNAYKEFTAVKHDNKKLSLYLTLEKELNVMVEDYITYTCKNPECGQEVRTQIQFPGGLQNLFIDSSITSELL